LTNNASSALKLRLKFFLPPLPEGFKPDLFINLGDEPGLVAQRVFWDAN